MSNLEYERVKKNSFVYAFLNTLSEVLESDAPDGNNSNNLIRKRIDDIKSTSLNSSRSVLEARFALGHNDDTYISQAVQVLWAGDGGDRLKIASPRMISNTMRHASADGIVKGMKTVASVRKNELNERLKPIMELCKYLMGVSEICTAVLSMLDILSRDQFPDMKRTHDLFRSNDNVSVEGHNVPDVLSKISNIVEDNERNVKKEHLVDILNVFKCLNILIDDSGMIESEIKHVYHSIQRRIDQHKVDLGKIQAAKNIVGTMLSPSLDDSFRSYVEYKSYSDECTAVDLAFRRMIDSPISKSDGGPSVISTMVRDVNETVTYDDPSNTLTSDFNDFEVKEEILVDEYYKSLNLHEIHSKLPHPSELIKSSMDMESDSLFTHKEDMDDEEAYLIQFACMRGLMSLRPPFLTVDVAQNSIYTTSGQKYLNYNVLVSRKIDSR